MQISVGLQEESYWHIFQSNALENFHNFFFRLGVSENHNIFDHRNTSLASLFDVIWGCLGLMDWKHKRALFGGVNVRGRDSQSRFVDLNKNRIYKVCITSVSLSLCIAVSFFAAHFGAYVPSWPSNLQSHFQMEFTLKESSRYDTWKTSGAWWET